MKIYERNPMGSAGPAHGTGAADGVDGQSSTRTGGARSSEDRAVLSGLASRLADALQAEQPDRAAHLAELKAAVGKGTYQPDARATSQAVIKDALEGGGA